ncbi:MAG: hypothetical protein IJ306_06980 [Oscillospiraceae bacterium]|nr:hypothetical protein [Oscillospiraceae bacterium]
MQQFPLIYVFYIFIAVAAVIAFAVPKKATYNKLDNAGLISNIILSVVYFPLSLLGFFSIFFTDNMSAYSEAIQTLIIIMVCIGVAMPFVSVLSIMSSVILRKRGKRIFSFAIQFLPLILFSVMITIFVTVGIINEF